MVTVDCARPFWTGVRRKVSTEAGRVRVMARAARAQGDRGVGVGCVDEAQFGFGRGELQGLKAQPIGCQIRLQCVA